MKLCLVIFLILSTYYTYVHSENCKNASEEDCENLTSEYEKYRECMEHRTKRSTGCSSRYEDTCDNCDCDSCETCSDCNSNEKCCNTCCPKKSSCGSSYNCCHKTCRAECRTNVCRSSCKKKCSEKQTIDSTDILKNNTVVNYHSKSDHNITTIIHLNNIINNTNLINLPINVNNTNVNNFTMETAGSTGTGTSNCCETISPRQCVPHDQPPYARCFHVRKNVCGNICTSPYLHFQRHEVCDDSTSFQNCKQQVLYIPQPQPRCAYQPQWPYVTCGNEGYHSCEGCYDHYIKKSDVAKCSNFCYDDGFGAGPYYRQGPFYRPGYAHLASCFQTGFCPGFNQFGTGGFPGYYPGLDFGGIPNGAGYPPWSYYNNNMDFSGFTVNTSNENPNSFSDEVVVNPMTTNVKLEDITMQQGITADINKTRSERYAEIKIRPVEDTTVAEEAKNETLR